MARESKDEEQADQKLIKLRNVYHITANDFVFDDESQSFQLTLESGEEILTMECNKYGNVPDYNDAPKGIDFTITHQTFDEVHIMLYFNNEAFRCWYLSPRSCKLLLMNIWQCKYIPICTYKGLLERTRFVIQTYQLLAGSLKSDQQFKYSISSGKDKGRGTRGFVLASEYISGCQKAEQLCANKNNDDEKDNDNEDDDEDMIQDEDEDEDMIQDEDDKQ